jgi:hypothetical protein
MPKVFTADAATRRAEQLDRTTTKWLAVHETEAEKLKAKEALQADAFTHTVAGDVYAGNSIDVESVAEESLTQLARIVFSRPNRARASLSLSRAFLKRAERFSNV